ncbi:DMT family transporter [Methylobacter svalbardensis]|uniref:DMT family transporter n=1 Tax=Methylobacter svalbardensis TaxID=3080016 RepID=UPI0030EB58C6
MLSILYGIASALSWGAADFAGALAARKLSAYRAVFYSNALGLLALFVSLAIYPETVPEARSIILAGVAGVFGSISLLILFYSMACGQISIAAPVSALFAAALPVLVGTFTQGLPAPIQFIGFGSALLAVWLISQGGEQRLHIDRLFNLILPLLAGFGFGSYFIFMHYAVIGIPSTIWPMIASYSTGTLMTFIFVAARRETFIVKRDAWGIILVNVVCNIGGNLFYILALKSGRLDISAVLSSLYPGGTVILAWLILKERISFPQWNGIIAALVAIILFTV